MPPRRINEKKVADGIVIRYQGMMTVRDPRTGYPKEVQEWAVYVDGKLLTSRQTKRDAEAKAEMYAHDHGRHQQQD